MQLVYGCFFGLGRDPFLFFVEVLFLIKKKKYDEPFFYLNDCFPLQDQEVQMQNNRYAHYIH